MTRAATAATTAIREMRDFLFAHGADYDRAVAGFSWPQVDSFNFALEWFDVVAADRPDRPAVQIVSADLTMRTWTYGDLSAIAGLLSPLATSLRISRSRSVSLSSLDAPWSRAAGSRCCSMIRPS